MKIWKDCFFKVLPLLFLLGCHNQKDIKKKPSSSIKINLATEPPCVDVKKIADSQSLFFALMCQDGLTRKNPHQALELSLAETLTLSEDQKTYLFKLRRALWSDGLAITAHDFVASWTKLLEPNFPSPYAHLLFDIEGAQAYKEGLGSLDALGIKATDDLTLEITLNAPNPHFLEILSSVHFFPYPESITKHNEQYLEGKQTSFICSGPFVVDSWSKRDRIVLKKNPLYWDRASVQLDTLEVYFIENAQTEIGMYERGQLDWIGSPFTALHQDAVPFLKKRKDFHSYPIAAVCFYIFNTKIFPLNNKNIRKALSLGIDRKEITEHLFETHPEAAFRFIPSSLALKDANQEDPYRLDKAKAFFLKGCKELAIDPQAFPKIQLFYHNGPVIHAKIAETIKQQWKELFNLDAELVSLEWKIYLDALHKTQFEIARSAIAPPYKDPAYFLQLFSKENSSLNYSGWYNPTFINLLDSAKKSSHSEMRNHFLLQAEELLLEEMPVAPLFFYTNFYLKKNSINNVVIDELNRADFKWATIDK